MTEPTPGDELTGALARAARALQAPPPAALPVGFAARVVSQATAPGSTLRAHLRTRLMGWLAGWFEPRTVRLRPALQLGLACVLCLLTGAATLMISRGLDEATPVLVRFTVAAPTARTVTVTGDFNGWDPGAIRLQDPTGDGHWQGLVPMQPGVYQYMFVIDDRRWIADPASPETIDDGFGQRNSVVRIGYESIAGGNDDAGDPL